MGVGLLEKVRRNVEIEDRRFLQRAYIDSRWGQPIPAQAESPRASLVGYYSIIPYNRLPTRGPTQTPTYTPTGDPYSAGGGGGGGASPGTYNETITTTAGTDASAVSGNQTTIPAGYNALAIWVGPISEVYAYVSLKIKINSTTKTARVLRDQWYVVQGLTAGDVVSFASQKKDGASTSLVDQSVSLSVCAMNDPGTLVTPTATTATANCDKAGPPYWNPSGTAHIVQTAESLTFKVNAASGRRELFLVEKDGAGNFTPARHIHVPDNVAVTVQMRHREGYLANYQGSTVSITGPSGIQIGGTSATYRPSFSANRTVTVTTAQELQTALSDNTPADFDDIVLSAGTYNMGSGLSIKPSNFGANSSISAMGKTLRIRGATGTASDVILNGAGVFVRLFANRVWVFESLKFDMSGIAPPTDSLGVDAQAPIDLEGTIHLWNVEVLGPSSTSTAPNIALRSSSTHGSVTASVLFSTLSNPAGDNLNTDNSGGTHRANVVGCTINSNGAAVNNQILTSHTGATIHAYGCTFTDAAITANKLRVAADTSTSKLFLSYCRCRSTDVAGTDGMEFSASHGVDGVFFCDFQALWQAKAVNYIIGSTLTQRLVSAGTSGSKFLVSSVTGQYPVYMGNRVLAEDTHTSSYDASELYISCELIGNLIQSQSNNPAWNFGATNPATAQTITSLGNYFKSPSSAQIFNITARANVGGTIYNCIVDAQTSHASIGVNNPGGSWDWTNNYIRRTNTVTNWDARFPSQLWASMIAGTSQGNTCSINAPAVGADYTPTGGGNVATSGIDPGWSGGVDILGRTLYLGQSWVRGCVELQAIRSGALFRPSQW